MLGRIVARNVRYAVRPPLQLNFAQRRCICDAKDAMIYTNWSKKIGQVVDIREDIVTAAPSIGFEGTFDFTDHKKSGKNELQLPVVRPLYHYMFCLPHHKKMTDLAHDGYEDTFSPPAPFTLRMWGGANTKFISPIFVGMHLRQKMFVKNSYLKQGRSGPFVLAVIATEIEGCYGPGGEWKPLIHEDLNFIYRHEKDSTVAEKPKLPVEPVPTHSKTIQLNSAHLFRYSALTYNSHKIHYDRKYATEKESYGGLLVHGPLQATLLANYATNFIHDRLTSFEYRAVSPLALEGETLDVTLHASPDEKHKGVWNVWMKGPANNITMTGKASTL